MSVCPQINHWSFFLYSTPNTQTLHAPDQNEINSTALQPGNPVPWVLLMNGMLCVPLRIARRQGNRLMMNDVFNVKNKMK